MAALAAAGCERAGSPCSLRPRLLLLLARPPCCPCEHSCCDADNDWGPEDNSTKNSNTTMLGFVKSLVAAGTPIDGVGLQGARCGAVLAA